MGRGQFAATHRLCAVLVLGCIWAAPLQAAPTSTRTTTTGKSRTVTSTTGRATTKQLTLRGTTAGSLDTTVEPVRLAKTTVAAKTFAMTTTKQVTGAKKTTSAAPTTAAPTTAAAVAVATVKVNFTVKELNFTKLTPYAKTAIIASVVDSILKELGAGYTKDHVDVVLKAGSVIAEVSITPVKGTTAARLSSTIMRAQRDNIATRVTAQVQTIPSIETALVDGKTLADIATIHTPPKVVSPAGQTTRQPGDGTSDVVVAFTLASINYPQLIKNADALKALTFAIQEGLAQVAAFSGFASIDEKDVKVYLSKFSYRSDTMISVRAYISGLGVDVQTLWATMIGASSEIRRIVEAKIAVADGISDVATEVVWIEGAMAISIEKFTGTTSAPTTTTTTTTVDKTIAVTSGSCRAWSTSFIAAMSAALFSAVRI